MSLSDYLGFDALTPAQRVEIQDWYARRYLATRDLGRRTIRLVRIPWPRPQPMLSTPVYLRERYPGSYKAKQPGSGGLGNSNWRGKASQIAG